MSRALSDILLLKNLYRELLINVLFPTSLIIRTFDDSRAIKKSLESKESQIEFTKDRRSLVAISKNTYKSKPSNQGLDSPRCALYEEIINSILSTKI